MKCMKSFGISYSNHLDGNRDAANSACDCQVRLAAIQESVRYCTRTEYDKPRTSYKNGVFMPGGWGSPWGSEFPLRAHLNCKMESGLTPGSIFFTKSGRGAHMIAAGIGTILPGARDTGSRLCYLSAAFHKYGCIRGPLHPPRRSCAPRAEQAIRYRLSGGTPGRVFRPGVGLPPTVLAQYASVATPCRMRRIDPLGATPYL